MAQVQRDMRRYGLHKSFLALIRRMLEPLAVRELQVNGLQALDQISAELDAILELEELMASVYFRPMMDRLTDLFYTACMAVEAAWELALKQDKTKQRLAEFYLYRRVMKRPLSDWTAYPEQISRLCYDVRPWKVDLLIIGKVTTIRFGVEDDGRRIRPNKCQGHFADLLSVDSHCCATRL